jgi:hypothetical protein
MHLWRSIKHLRKKAISPKLSQVAYCLPPDKYLSDIYFVLANSTKNILKQTKEVQ